VYLLDKFSSWLRNNPGFGARKDVAMPSKASAQFAATGPVAWSSHGKARQSKGHASCVRFSQTIRQAG